MVTVRIPATDPAKVTLPEAGAATASPYPASKSTPQWPPYWPTGAYSATTGPETGGLMQTATAKKSSNKNPPFRLSRTYGGIESISRGSAMLRAERIFQ